MEENTRYCVTLHTEGVDRGFLAPLGKREEGVMPSPWSRKG